MAKGVVFMTIIKAGFMFTGRYGTGLVIARLPDNTWSPPSALAISGMGWGLQIGVEVTEVLLILSTDSAVDAFKSRAQISIGAELGVSVGPIGRSLASDLSAGNKGAAHAFSYAHSKGLYFGASLEAAGIAARPDVNRKFYGQKLTPSVILSGEYPRPRGAQPLYDALDETLGTSSPSAGGGSHLNLNGRVDYSGVNNSTNARDNGVSTDARTDYSNTSPSQQHSYNATEGSDNGYTSFGGRGEFVPSNYNSSTETNQYKRQSDDHGYREYGGRRDDNNDNIL
eukprot:CAMPEP_0119051560 /NCGR_PEP_ID=MMETSP1177-20130426/73131_1 /TAXON_ID=2985 /ORGANISM="Ochromonas sp, Strain CCMP1899" /LENGTH=282 /DNA_ID=CAMNT_0007030801 /DNA_START=614 /DNA_END=1462 /DNA_ORIENTATION=+